MTAMKKKIESGMENFEDYQHQDGDNNIQEKRDEKNKDSQLCGRAKHEGGRAAMLYGSKEITTKHPFLQNPDPKSLSHSHLPRFQ